MYNILMSDDKPTDDDLFQKMMHGIKPLKQDTHKPHKPKLKAKKIKQPIEPRQLHDHFDFNIMNQERWVDGKANARYFQSGVQPKTINQLKSGKLPIEARLDLHHYRAGEAIACVDQFIDECLSEGVRCVLIIHGKGYMSDQNKPILKNLLIEHLRNHAHVLGYHSAIPRDGGTGALYVLFKGNVTL